MGSGAAHFQRSQTMLERRAGWNVLLRVISFVGLFPVGALYAEVDWRPERTWVFAVGVLEWQDPNVWHGMANAKPNRRDFELVQHLRKSGIPNERIVYLQDRDATLGRIRNEMSRLLPKAQSGDLLLFYFTGHGFRDHKNQRVHFANYDATDGQSAWPVRSIFEELEQHFRGDRVILMADCCYSGGLADEARLRKSKLGYACLCSSFSHNSSTGRWTFTDSLLDGLRGNPRVDLNADGEIELTELGQFSELQMAFIEQQKAVYDSNASFPRGWRLSIPAQSRRVRQGERIEAEWKGKWYRAEIVESSGDHCKVHYVGFGDEWDELVGPERMREFRPHRLAEGTAIEVKWLKDQKWYSAKVLRSWYGLLLVHYDGYSTEWDEWVNLDQVRLPEKRSE